MKKTHRLAPDYDLEYKEKKEDLGFWADLVKKLKVTSVTELGVGTGRVLFPLVESCFFQLKKAVGIEVDESLLSQAREKLRGEYPSIKSKIKLHQADMRSFELKEKFDFIFIPFNTFSLVYDLEERLTVLRQVKKHLTTQGYFAFEVYAPNLLKLWEKSQKRIVSRKEFLNKVRGVKLVRIRTARYYPASQIIENRYDYKKYRLEDNKLIEKYSTKFRLYKTFPNELRLMLKMSGLSLIHFWGNYQGNKFNDDSSKMIVVAKNNRNPKGLGTKFSS